MRRSRRESATTRARRASATAGREAAQSALDSGAVLRLSSRTDLEAGTVHHGTARKLVAYGMAQYPPDPVREGWRDLSKVMGRAR